MADFKAKLLLQLQDEFTGALKRATKQAEKSAKTTESKWKKAFSSMQKDFGKARANISKGTGMMKSSLMGVGKAFAFAAPVGLAIKSAAEFESKMVEIASVTDKTAAEIKRDFTGIVEEMQIQFGQKAPVVQKALYDGFSAGVPVTQKAVKAYLNSVGRLSTVGATDMVTAADVITTASNAWGVSFSKGADLLFASVKAGKTTLPEIAASFGQISGIAKPAGLSLAQTGTAIAALTSTGMKTPEAITGVKAAITSILKPSAIAAKLFSAYNIQIGQAAIQNKGLTGILEDVTDKLKAKGVEGSDATNVIAKLFPNVKSLGVMLSGTGAASEKFTDTLKFMNSVMKRSGTEASLINTKFKEAAQTTTQKFNSAMQAAAVAWKRFGAIALPIASRLLTALTPLIVKFGDFINENQELIKSVGKQVFWLGKLYLSFQALKFVGGLTTTIFGFGQAVVALSKTLKIATAVQWAWNLAMSANPIALAVAGVVALTAAGTALYIYWDDIVKWFKTKIAPMFELWGKLKETFSLDSKSKHEQEINVKYNKEKLKLSKTTSGVGGMEPAKKFDAESFANSTTKNLTNTSKTRTIENKTEIKVGDINLNGTGSTAEDIKQLPDKIKKQLEKYTDNLNRKNIAFAGGA